MLTKIFLFLKCQTPDCYNISKNNMESVKLQEKYDEILNTKGVAHKKMES